MKLPGQDAQDYSYGHDPHGNVSLLIKQSGGAKASYGYTAYGESDASLTRGDTNSRNPLNTYDSWWADRSRNRPGRARAPANRNDRSRGISHRCGYRGTQSCAGTEGDASDPAFSTRSVVVDIATTSNPIGSAVKAARMTKAAVDAVDHAREAAAAAKAARLARSRRQAAVENRSVCGNSVTTTPCHQRTGDGSSRNRTRSAATSGRAFAILQARTFAIATARRRGRAIVTPKCCKRLTRPRAVRPFSQARRRRRGALGAR